MGEFFRNWLVWCYLYVQHVFVMMYWATIPGLLACAFLNVRYRGTMREKLRLAPHGARSVLYAIAFGMTSSVSRRESLGTTSTFIAEGVSPAAALAYFIASQSLRLYFLLFFTVLIGFEFGLGLFLGGLATIILTAISMRFMASLPLRNRPAAATFKLQAQEGLSTDWRTLLLSSRGWGAAIRDIGHTFRVAWLSSLGGLLLGGLILAVDMHNAWPLPFWLGNEDPGPAFASAFFGPILALISFSFPLGNLVVASSIWKTWTVAYPGIISFVLASSLHPLNFRSLMNPRDRRIGWYMTAILYLSAALGGLTVIGSFELIGLQVTHVPWFEPLVKKIIMSLPFTMLGTGGMSIMGKMEGM